MKNDSGTLIFRLKRRISAIWIRGMRRLFAIAGFVSFIGLAAAATSPEVQRGLDWLQAYVVSIGSNAPSSKTATDPQTQCEISQTLLKLSSSNSRLNTLVRDLAAVTNADQATEVHACLESLQQKLGIQTTNADVAARRAADGGYAAFAGGAASNVLDTGAALDTQLQKLSASELAGVLDFLRTRQSASGAFETPRGSSILTSAIVLRGLKRLASQNPTAAALAQTTSVYLMSQQANNGAWGNDVALSALVYEAVFPYTAAKPEVTAKLKAFLLANQATDGSWMQDAYVTSVALRALTLVSETPVNPTLAAVKVQFVDAITAAAISGVNLASIGSSIGSIGTTSNANGVAEIYGVPAGGYQLQASSPGYSTVSLNINLGAGQTLDLGRVQMLVPTNSSKAVLSGQVREQSTNQALAGALISVEGQNLTALTAADGSYVINNIVPGSIVVNASKVGYASVAGSATASAGQGINFSPLLSASNAAYTSTLAECKIQGKTLDAVTLQPIAGVSIALSGSNTGSVATDPSGGYSLAGLVSGSTIISASKAGYDTVNASTRLVCSATRSSTTDFSPKLYATASTPINGNKASLNGLVIDAGTNRAITGAQLVITPEIGAAQTVQAGADGSFAAKGLDGATVQIQVQASGYQGITLQYVLSPLQNFDVGQIRLRAPKVEQLLPDFKVLSINRTNAITDPQTLLLSGRIEVLVVNAGNQTAAANVDVIAFSDVNRNNSFDGVGDVGLGQSVLTQVLAPGQTATLQINVQGVQLFRDMPIHVVIDPNNQVAESSKANNSRSTAQEALLLTNTQGFSSPVLKWHWSGAGAPYPSFNRVMTTPVTGRVLDTNGDGVINELDISVVIFATYSGTAYDGEGVIRIVRGDTGQLLNSIYDPARIAGASTVAIADLDGDGKPEIISATVNNEVIVFRNDGTRLWMSSPVSGRYASEAAVTVADLLGNGKPNIIFRGGVFSSTGQFLWKSQFGETGNSYSNADSYISAPVVADLFGSGQQDVIFGAAVYKADGSLRWYLHDGYPAIADLNGDGIPEIIVTYARNVYAYSRDGALLWRTAINTDFGGGPPTIADFDGDGQPDIGVSGIRSYVVFRANGSLIWQAPAYDGSGITGSTVFDFDGDGRAEVMYADERKFRIFDGSTGTELWNLVNSSGTLIEYPVVADIDNDGRADLLVVANDLVPNSEGGFNYGVRAYSSSSWVGVRNTWNQHAYSINNINDDLTVPRNPVPSWQTHNTFRLNKRIDGDPRAIADLTIGYLRVADGGVSGTSTLTVRAGNAGSYKVPVGTIVAFYRSNPALGTPTASDLIGTTTISQELQSGQYQDITLQVVGSLASLSANNTVWIVGDDNGAGKSAISDFDRSNNTLSGNLSGIAVNVNVAVSTDKPTYIESEQAIFTSPVTNAGSFARDVQVRYSVRDAAGKLVEVLPLPAIVNIAAGATVPVQANWPVSGVLAGNYQVLAELVSPQGIIYGSATATFAVQASQALLNSARISADRVNYSAAQNIQLTSRVTNASSNTVQDNVRAVTEVFNSAGTSVFTQSEPIAQLTPNGQRSYNYSLPAGSLLSGNYPARVQLLSAQGSVLAQSSTSFVVQDTSQTGIGLRGQLQANPSVALIGQSVSLNLQVNNNGNATLSNLPVTIRVVDPQTGSVLATYTQTLASLTAGQSLPVNATWTSAGLDGQILIAAATANLNGREIALAQAQIRLQGIAKLAVSPSQINFGTTTLSSSGQVSPTVASQLITVRSIGSAPVQSLSFALSGADASAFVIQGGTCTSGMALAINASCTLSLGYQPTISKTHQANLSVGHAAAGNIPESVSLQGQAIQAQTSISLQSQPIIPKDARILVLASCAQSSSSNGSNGHNGHHEENDDDDDDDRRTNRGNSCSPQPQQSSCVSERSQAIGQYLDGLGILNKVVTDEASFRHEMRCGGYNTYWISGGASKLEHYLVKEVREAVWRGDGLIIDGQHDDRNLLLDAVAGVKYRGKLPGTNYTASIPATSVFAQGGAASTLATLGQPAKYDLLTGQGQGQSQMQARFTANNSHVPAIVSNRYGAGQAMLFAFDLAAMVTQDIQQTSTINLPLQHIVSITAGQVGGNTMSQTLTVGDIQAQGLSLSNPSAQTVTAQITLNLPAQLTFSSASLTPNSVIPSSGAGTATVPAQINWQITLAPQQSQQLTWRVKVQSAPTSTAGTATYSVPVQVFGKAEQGAGSSFPSSFQLQATHNFSVSVISGSALIARALPAVQALQPVPSNERSAKARAITAITSATSLHNQARYNEAIVQWINAANELISMSSLSSAGSSSATQANYATYTAARTAVAQAIEASTDGQCQALICLRGDLAFGSATPVLGSTLNISRAVTNSCPAQLKDIPITASLRNRRTGQEVLNLWDNLTIPTAQTNTRNAAWQVQGPQQGGQTQAGDIIDGILTADWQGHRITLDQETAQITAPIIPACPAGGTVATSRFTAFSELERLEVRGGRPGSADWEWGLGANTQATGQFTQANLDWISGTSYNWTLVTDVQGKGIFTVRNGSTVVAQGNYDKPSTKLKSGNAIRLNVKTSSDAGNAKISATLLKIEGQTVNHSVITTGANQSNTIVITHPSLTNGMTAEGTIKLDFTGSAPPQGSRLNFLLHAGQVQCP